MRGITGLALAGLMALAALAQAQATAAPKVVASVAPVHSLVAGVMDGVGEPALLVPAGASPHTFTMRPSDAKRIDEADIVFWVGEGLESFLVKPLSALGNGRAVALMEASDLKLLPYRDRNGDHDHDHDHDHAHEHGHDHGHEHASHDSHVWLDPENARRIVRHIAVALTASDGPHGDVYAQNAKRLLDRIDALDADLRSRLKPVREAPFIVFHDAYQYLEQAYGLKSAGSVTVSAEQPPGARRLREIRARIAESGARCVFAEPQFNASLIVTVTEGTQARSAQLDPLGAGIEPGPDQYFTLMRNLADTLAGCLGTTG